MNEYQEALETIRDEDAYNKEREKEYALLQQLIDSIKPLEFEDLKIGMKVYVPSKKDIYTIYDLNQNEIQIEVWIKKGVLICVEPYYNNNKFYPLPVYMEI